MGAIEPVVTRRTRVSMRMHRRMRVHACAEARRANACAAMGEPPRRARPPASESAGESANSYRRVECGYVLIS
ncbi:hypothetical protein BUH_5360 [Burkholderia pseudomallei Pakistan 9]|nr:hypothetical protein BUH_5360 [Burkholderia pseudomallei Pakistan 9]